MAAITKAIHVGVDVGQKVDPSAIGVVELQLRGQVRDSIGHIMEAGDIHFVVRHLERLPLRTPYPAVADRVIEICDKLENRQGTIQVYMDATGVGQPVVDMFEERSTRWSLTNLAIGHGRRSLTPIYLTGSNRAVFEDGELRLGKALLVSRLQVLLQQGLIHLPQTAEADVLVDELLNYEIRVNENAHAQFGAFKTGTHDDLVTALGLACWYGPDGGYKTAWAKAIW
jgi:hypothetical protein